MKDGNIILISISIVRIKFIAVVLCVRQRPAIKIEVERTVGSLLLIIK